MGRHPKWMIATSAAGDAEVKTFVKRLKDAGVRIEEPDDVQDTVGVVFGTFDPKRRKMIEKIPGVVGVEQQRGVQLAPPDSEVQ